MQSMKNCEGVRPSSATTTLAVVLAVVTLIVTTGVATASATPFGIGDLARSWYQRALDQAEQDAAVLFAQRARTRLATFIDH